jgi:ATP-binding cassette, subfamily C, bacterial exporter for protease/lipase
MAAPNQNAEAFRRLLGGVKHGYLLVFIASIGMNLLVLASPIYMMQMYDRVLLTGSIDTLVFLTVICAVAMMVMGALDAIRAMLLGRIGAWVERTLRFELLSGVLRVAFERGNSYGQQLLADLQAVKNFLGSAQIAPVFDAPWAPIFLAIIWVIHPWMGIFATVAALLLLGLALATDFLTRKKMKEMNADQIAFARFSQQVIANHDIVLGMGMTTSVFARMRGLLERLQADGTKVADLIAILSGTSKFLRMFVQIGILGLGAYLVVQGSMTSGGMLGASIILGRALAPVEQAIGSWRMSVGAIQSFRRIYAFFSAVGFTRAEFSLPEARGEVSVEGLVYAAPGKEKAIIRGMNFALKPGTVLAVIGPSGAGKTTLCRLLVGSLRPNSGHVRLDGADVSSWNRDELGKSIGYLPQSIELFEGAVRDNIARFRAASDEEVVEAAELARCHAMILRLSKGYLTEVGEAGAYLSGGERQRIGLARAVFGRPKLVVLDEPNSNLDHEGEQALLQAMTELKKQGCTIVIVTHRPSLLSAVDMVAIIREGTLDRVGERDAILRDLGVQAMPAPRPAQAVG